MGQYRAWDWDIVQLCEIIEQDCVSIELGHGFLLGVASRAGPDIMRSCENIERSCDIIMHFCDNIMQLCEIIEQGQDFSLEAGAASK